MYKNPEFTFSQVHGNNIINNTKNIVYIYTYTVVYTIQFMVVCFYNIHYTSKNIFIITY